MLTNLPLTLVDLMTMNLASLHYHAFAIASMFMFLYVYDDTIFCTHHKVP